MTPRTRAALAAAGVVLGVLAASERVAAAHTTPAPDPRLDEARALAAAGEKDRAAALLSERLSAAPDDPAVLDLLGQVEIARLRPDRAAPMFQRLTELNPDVFATYARLGEAFILEGRLADAAATYRRLAARFPRNSQVASALAALEEDDARIGRLRRTYGRLGWAVGGVSLFWIAAFAFAVRRISSPPKPGA